MKLVALACLSGACAGDSIGPRLGEVIPARATAGASVELRGERFCAMRSDCVAVAAKVEIGLDPPMVQANVIAYSSTTATIQIPTIVPAGPTEIVLTVDGRSSNALDFEVLP